MFMFHNHVVNSTTRRGWYSSTMIATKLRIRSYKERFYIYRSYKNRSYRMICFSTSFLISRNVRSLWLWWDWLANMSDNSGLRYVRMNEWAWTSSCSPTNIATSQLTLCSSIVTFNQCFVVWPAFVYSLLKNINTGNFIYINAVL